MKITVDDHRKIFAIQEEFNKVFPYLKLEFFSKSNNANLGSAPNYLRYQNKTIGEFRTIHNSANIDISPNMTVIDLDQGFRDTYGIIVQVFRKSGKVWLETTHTDGWTLEEQNLQGEALSKDNIS